MMGSGKSTIGEMISKDKKLNFIDTDKLIEKYNNLKIIDIFKKKGENFFRKSEEKITINSLIDNLTFIEVQDVEADFISSTVSSNCPPLISTFINQSSGNIIAVGGGAFLNEKIRNEISKNSISIWLHWSENILIKRIINSKKRPKVYLLNEKELSKLINERSKIYSKADYKINCDKLNRNKIVEKILEIYEKE